MIDAFFEIIRWVVVGPIVFARLILRMFQWFDFWFVSYRHEIVCRNCGSAISLVGMWRCRCGYTYKGHLLRPCPVCGSVPQMARCFQCGITEKLPEL